MPTTLNISITRRVGLVSMARPQVRNAFNETTIAELTEAFRTLGADPGVRAIVLAGEGPAFCAGADLDWMRRMSQYSRDENLADAMKLATMLRVIYECPKPVIARVHGAAFAGGVGLGGRTALLLCRPPGCRSSARPCLRPADTQRGPEAARAFQAPD